MFLEIIKKIITEKRSSMAVTFEVIADHGALLRSQKYNIVRKNVKTKLTALCS